MRSHTGYGALFIVSIELEFVGLTDFVAKQALCLHLAWRNPKRHYKPRASGCAQVHLIRS